MNFKQDTTSVPKLSKEKWLSLDMHAETISVILQRMHSRNDRAYRGKKKGRPGMQYMDNIKKWTRASLEENIRVTEDAISHCMPTLSGVEAVADGYLFSLIIRHFVHQRHLHRLV